MNPFQGVPVDEMLCIKGKRGYGVSIAIAQGDEIRTCCSGSGRFGQDFPVTPDTLFQAGSVSKPMFALTLLRCADKGILDLDADLSEVLKDFADGPLTFPALLSHTAGYNVHGFPGYRAKHRPLSLEEVLLGRGNSPKVRRTKPAGAQFCYSGGGITLAELAFTRLTGMSLREAFEKEVAIPLGLRRSGYFQPLDEERIPGAAFGGTLGIWEDRRHGYHYYPEHAAAGLWTTPTELAKVGVALSRSVREGGLLRRETAERMVTPVMDNVGLSVFREREVPGVAYHGGQNWGFLTTWVFSLTEDLCVTAMINCSRPLLAGRLNEVCAALFRQAREAMRQTQNV